MCVAGGWLFVIANEEKCGSLDNTDMEHLVVDQVFRLGDIFSFLWRTQTFASTTLEYGNIGLNFNVDY